jgi:beta-glucosidase
MSEPELFRDPSKTWQERVDDLLPRLTLTEKVGQLNQKLLGWQAWSKHGDRFTTTERLDRELDRRHGIGAIYGLQRADAWSGRTWSNGIDPAQAAEVTALVQERIRARSRFGIPALMVEEAPHGHQALGSQLMPTNIGVAATWQPELLEEAAAHVARELRARGAHVALVSGLDMLRDPRWGRSEESFGEDPLLASAFTRAFVRGMQRDGGLAALLKHFAGQGAGIGGRNGSGAPIGPRELREIHLPAAIAGIDEGALGVMAAYNDLDGIPCCANQELLTGTLREEWGFEGIVMADMGAIDRLIPAAGSERAAGILALRSGVDLSLCDHAYQDLDRAVEEGELEESFVDRAARRVLGLKIRLGLLDPDPVLPSFPVPDPQVELAASIPVLLKNELLPLPAIPKRIAVIGPNADDVQCLLGDYVPPLQEGTGTTVLRGILMLAGDAEVGYEEGCRVTGPVDGGLERAAALAADADLAVLVLGGTSVRSYDDQFDDNGAAAAPAVATSGEGFDVQQVELPTAQRELAAAVGATGTPTVAVIIAGRPHGLGGVIEHSGSVVYAWYQGPEGGRRIAELLLGDREPTGRLAATIAARTEQLPQSYNNRMEHSRRYVDGDAEPEFRFGFGLGYTTWQLGAASLDGGWPELALTAELTNTGSRRGTQVVQLYARAWVSGITPRRAVLLGWTRVELDPGEPRIVRVPVDRDALPGLGDLAGGRLELWLSIDGAGDPVGQVEFRV